MSEHRLSQLALLYLATAQSDDGTLSSVELDAVINALHNRYFDLDHSDVQQVVLDVLEAASGGRREQAAEDVLRALDDSLSPRQKQAVLEDLMQVARSDGVVLRGERGRLHALADLWNVPLPMETPLEAPPPSPEPAPSEATEALHDLAFLYLVLAHGTDSEFSDDERLLLLRKLREWQPDLSEAQVATVLERALDRYARRADAEAVHAAIEAVKTALPAEQRMAALHDLTQIANADGIFLDSEEDLINELMTAWDVDPYATYGRHGSKE